MAAVAKVDLRHSAGTEIRVENAAGVIPRNGEILDHSVLRDSESSRDNPAIGLKRGRARWKYQEEEEHESS
jgi:hypothetical protein